MSPQMVCANLDEAKAAAQADFERRILSNITPAPITTALPKVITNALDRLPDGFWEVWTSCSFRRISRRGGGDGGVLRGTVQRSDGHPDLSWDEKTCQALCDLVNGLRTLTQQDEVTS